MIEEHQDRIEDAAKHEQKRKSEGVVEAPFTQTMVVGFQTQDKIKVQNKFQALQDGRTMPPLDSQQFLEDLRAALNSGLTVRERGEAVDVGEALDARQDAFVFRLNVIW